MSTKANFITGADVLDSWRDDVLSGKAPVLYAIGTGDLERIEIGPGMVTLIGGAPGAGKTAFTMQAITDAMRLTPTLRVQVCNVEMPANVLLDRQLARLSGIDLTTIRHRRFGAEHADRLDQAINTLAAVTDRLCFLRPPFDLGNVAATADEFGANVLALDYVQRLTMPGDDAEARHRVNRTMDCLRQFADAGVAVIVVSAVGRTKDSGGRSSYSGDGLNLASFRESSELEFGADDAFILHPANDDAEGDLMVLKHLKSRHGECKTMMLNFDRRHQSFSPSDAEPTVRTERPKGKAAKGPNRAEKQKLQSALSALWNRTPTAPPDAEGDDDEQ